MDHPVTLPRGNIVKAFLAFIADMVETSTYLSRANFVKALSKSIKVDDVTITLSRKAQAVDTWLTKNFLRENTFFVAYPIVEVLQI